VKLGSPDADPIGESSKLNTSGLFASGSGGPVAKAKLDNPTLDGLRTGRDSGGGTLGTQTLRTQTLARAIPSGRWFDIEYDGATLGAGGQAYSADTPIAQIPPVTPQPGNATATDERVYLVNGITINREANARQAQMVANTSGASVYSIHNSTSAVDPTGVTGVRGDVAQTALDIAEMELHGIGQQVPAGGNPATVALTEKIKYDLLSSRKVHVVSYSQGSVLTSNALSRVKRDLMERYGYDFSAGAQDAAAQRRNAQALQRAERTLSNVRVETCGGAASFYPDGPRYTHYVNQNDPIATTLGVSQPAARPGRDSSIVKMDFETGNPLWDHLFESYWKRTRS
jgi:hypothetical protein